LQRHFGISADEALYVRPAWELNNLLAHYQQEGEGD
jgi:phosphotransferase system HPr-like phosphotransfer protein